ncbi:MAG: exopolyphosphatase / guanosine-5-triphosphate,3-diphosphate pyrophosphatase [Solirubrobacteraceae bacterium]|jgi:exopolyphosphatase/guanosine-5'-triphosphate,3'-diphosphate pyrophosphatase|nr:exopolyphosphatase / guanosine-5-triphosphate,3-diphosphate pyrophosphatase [Solirubrobacteraceae bacterium]
MRCACIDIGSNTTRLLVADVDGTRISEVHAERAFTRLGAALRRDGTLTPATIADHAVTVGEQLASAERAGATRLRIVATAAIRAADNGAALCAAITDWSGVAVDVLTAGEEARLAFAGAMATHPEPPRGRVAVVDVGGGSSEIAVGTLTAGVEWSCSVPFGSSSLADEHLHADPPLTHELRALASGAASMLNGLDVPAVDLALAVGGSATSMTRLAGALIDAAAIERALGVLCAGPSAAVAAARALDPERVRLLPAGLHILGAIAERLGCPLTVGSGGLREGVCLDLVS